jgi:hypothetical protein
MLEVVYTTADGGAFSSHPRCVGPIGSAAIHRCNFADGSLATEPSRAKIHRCALLLSNSEHWPRIYRSTGLQISDEAVFALAKALLLPQRWKYSRQLFKVGNSSIALFRVLKLAFVYSAIKFA